MIAFVCTAHNKFLDIIDLYDVITERFVRNEEEVCVKKFDEFSIFRVFLFLYVRNVLRMMLVFSTQRDGFMGKMKM